MSNNTVKPNGVGFIAILLPCLLTGGTEVATLETAKAFQSLGYSVEVVVYFDEIDPTMFSTFQQAGLVVHLLGVMRTGGYLDNVYLTVRLFKALLGRRWRAIWLQYMTPTLIPLSVVKLFTSNVIAAVHVSASHYSPSSLARLRWLARHWCARFVCVSRTVAIGVSGSDIVKVSDEGRVLVIPNALDIAAVHAAIVRDWRVEAGWPRNVVVLGFAGRLAHIKGADVLIHAVARLHGQGLPVRLVVVGSGVEQANLEKLAQRLDIGAITHFAGRMPREAIFGAIKGFDIAAVPSREEGFGLSALEAMAAGVPVVASRVDALQEVVLSGVTGLLSKVDDAECLAFNLTRLVDDVELRQRLGSAGRDHASRFYDVSAYRARLADLLKGIGLPVSTKGVPG